MKRVKASVSIGILIFIVCISVLMISLINKISVNRSNNQNYVKDRQDYYYKSSIFYHLVYDNLDSIKDAYLNDKKIDIKPNYSLPNTDIKKINFNKLRGYLQIQITGKDNSRIGYGTVQILNDIFYLNEPVLDFSSNIEKQEVINKFINKTDFNSINSNKIENLNLEGQNFLFEKINNKNIIVDLDTNKEIAFDQFKYVMINFSNTNVNLKIKSDASVRFNGLLLISGNLSIDSPLTINGIIIQNNGKFEANSNVNLNGMIITNNIISKKKINAKWDKIIFTLAQRIPEFYDLKIIEFHRSGNMKRVLN